MRTFISTLVLLALSSQSFADNTNVRNFFIDKANRGQRATGWEGVHLDAPYQKHGPSVGAKRKFEMAQPRTNGPTMLDVVRAQLPKASNVLQTIAMQSPVKSQGSRGSCSIFSATALLEAHLIRNRLAQANNIDLSEQWLEYLATRYKSSDGSNSYTNFANLFKFGSPKESTLPYNTQNWKDIGLADPNAQTACGAVPANLLTGCLIAQRDPRLLELSDQQLAQADPVFYQARQEAAKMRALEMRNPDPSRAYKMLGSVEEVKAYLAKGIPVTLDMDFHYGAWNHRKADQLGIDRNQEHWDKGIIFYPVPGSLDVKLSRTSPAGHSVLVVGYDDTVKVTRTVKMEDGSSKTVTYTGVYYFKNSWGTTSFGVKNTLNGQLIPGYGVMVQDYAQDFGEFFAMPLGG